ncbi:MAG: enoyl-CoA hydratase/isomerase family protein, partial [Deltaproteobacteria bacterium]|nr:enoyl-CoA hydratase/isomerase family protein [Deltaproteobacteria bacterium]
RPDTAKRRLMRSHQIYGIVEGFEWPVIAAIHGFCLGAGLELALCCDIRYAEETAKLGFPEVKLSIFPGNGGTRRALYHVPLGKVKELVYSGDMIDASEAFRLGLVEKVTPDGRVMDAAMELAAKIIKRGPLGVAAAKKVLNRTRDMALQPGLDLESDFLNRTRDMALQPGLDLESDFWANLTSTKDMKEGATAFIEKRKPEYKGI